MLVDEVTDCVDTSRFEYSLGARSQVLIRFFNSSSLQALVCASAVGHRSQGCAIDDHSETATI